MQYTKVFYILYIKRGVFNAPLFGNNLMGAEKDETITPAPG